MLFFIEGILPKVGLFRRIRILFRLGSLPTSWL